MINLYSLPDWLVTAVERSNNMYSSGDSDYTATGLLTPPKIAHLRREHKDEILSDVSENIASFIGTGVHNHLEKIFQDDDRYITEKRYFHDFEGKRISAQIDLFDKETKTLTDFKFTSVFKMRKEDQPEYDFQLNLGRWLMQKSGIEVDHLRIGGFPLDWRNSEAKRQQDYPPCKFVCMEIPLWEEDQILSEVRTRIRDHEEAKKGNVRPCTDEERWATKLVWAAMKKGRKSAIKLFDVQPSLDQVKALGGTFIEERPKTYRRCAEYCEVVKWCDQYGS